MSPEIDTSLEDHAPVPSAPRRFFRFVGRCVYRCAAAAIWLILIAVALETCERGKDFIAERLYQGYCNSQNNKVYKMGPAKDSGVRAEPAPLKQGTELPPVPVASVPAPAETPDKIKAAREAYAALSDENRNVIATLNGEVYMTCDRTGRCLKSLGEPAMERFARTAIMNGDIANAVRSATEPTRVPFMFIETFVHYGEAAITPEKNAAGDIETVQTYFKDMSDTYPAERLCPQPVPADSACEVPFFRYKKNFRQYEHREGGIRYGYNNYGFRDADVVVPKPQGVFRIACVGGSTTEEGNSNEETYPNILEQKLKARFGENAVDVVNCGIVGINSYGERARISDYLEIQPDMLLYYNGINDICNRHFALWQNDVEPWQKLLRQSRFLNRWFNGCFLPADAEIEAFMRATTMRNLKAMGYAARERGVVMAICSFAYPHVLPLDFRGRFYLDLNLERNFSGGLIHFATYIKFLHMHNRLVKEICEQEGMLYVPVAENMEVGLDYFSDACHMTRDGLELKTDVIGAFISKYMERNRPAGVAARQGP